MMKLKIVNWTRKEGEDYYVVCFMSPEVRGTFGTMIIQPDGYVGPGPRIPVDQMIGQPNCKCVELEVDLPVPSQALN